MEQKILRKQKRYIIVILAELYGKMEWHGLETFKPDKEVPKKMPI